LPYLPAVRVSSDGRLAATIRCEAGPVIFDIATRKVLRQLPPLPPPVSIFNDEIRGWTAGGKSLLISRQLTTADCDLLLVDAVTGAVRLRVPTGAAWAVEATADPAGRFLALVLNDGTLRPGRPKDGHALAPPLRPTTGCVQRVDQPERQAYLGQRLPAPGHGPGHPHLPAGRHPATRGCRRP
jgi:hypothetical protein